MASCNLLHSCFFFSNGLAEMPCTTERLKDKYCKGNYTACARFIVFNTYGRDWVSPYLSPNDTFGAQKAR